MAQSLKGVFISFEGAEGSGKSTQIRLLDRYLKDSGYDVLTIREPGGVRISETVREILLDVGNVHMSKECEVLLYMAARAQLVEEILIPALEQGKIVLCDRYLDSTIAYQGYGHNMDLRILQVIGKFATRNLSPDLTILFDIEAAKGLSRTGKHKDRIEQRSLSYHETVRQGYLHLAQQHAKRIKVVKVDKNKEQIFQEVRQLVSPLLKCSNSL